MFITSSFGLAYHKLMEHGPDDDDDDGRKFENSKKIAFKVGKWALSLLMELFWPIISLVKLF